MRSAASTDIKSCVEYEDVSGQELKALRAVVKAAKECHDMEYARHVEENIPTPEWMANLANAIEAHEKLQKI